MDIHVSDQFGGYVRYVYAPEEWCGCVLIYCDLLGLVYLRFSGLLFYEDGKLVWKTSDQGWSIGRLLPWSSRNPSISSFHATGESGSNGTRVTPAEPNGVGKQLKIIARRLMFYPFSKLLLPLEVLCFLGLTDENPTVYLIVTIPVSVCRMGVMAGWTPPFPLYVFAGVSRLRSYGTDSETDLVVCLRSLSQAQVGSLASISPLTTRC